MFRIKKVFSLTFLVSFFIGSLFPLPVSAVLQIPDIEGTITIVKYTIGGDDVFNFQVDEEQDFQSSQRFDVQVSTSNLIGSQDLVLPGGGSTYYIKEDPAAGWDFSDVYCGSLTHESTTYVLGDVAVVQLATGDHVHCIFTNKKTGNEKIPVLIIPGIAGTELYNGNDWIWMNLSSMYSSVNDRFLSDALVLSDSGETINQIATGDIIRSTSLDVPIIGTVLKINSFEYLIYTLQEQGYQEDDNFFVFPYDWRLDLVETENQLNQKIAAIKSLTGSQKIDIVAHSMGGLLTKAYLQKYGNSSVNKLIFVGTPHLGAPKAGKVLLEGDRFGIPWLEEDRIRDIALNSPALHELLPSPAYFDVFQGYIRRNKIFGTNPLMSYEETKDYYISEQNKNPLMFRKAEELYDIDLPEYDFSGIDVYNIAGCKTSTQAAYSLSYGDDGIGGVGYTSGDGTVPLVSADYINTPTVHKFYVKGADHAELPSTEGARQLITNILTGQTLSTGGNISNSSAFCNFKGKSLSWHSPVEVHIYDATGNHTGPIENNGIEYGIPNIDYEVLGHDKFIFLPTDEGQEYMVRAKGLGEGTFDLQVSDVANGEVIKTVVFNDVPVEQGDSASFGVNEQLDATSIELEDSEGAYTLQASAILQGDLGQDLFPPETSAVLAGKEHKEGSFVSEVEVSLSTMDDYSGAMETWYSLNGKDFQPYDGPFILEKKGEYKLYYYSVDNAGNNEEVLQLDIKIGKIGSKYRKYWKDKKCKKIIRKGKKIENKIYKKVFELKKQTKRINK